MDDRSPAQVFALVIGITLVVAGIARLLLQRQLRTGDGTERDAVLGILDVNGWHNLVPPRERRCRPLAVGLVSAGTRLRARPSAWSTCW